VLDTVGLGGRSRTREDSDIRLIMAAPAPCERSTDRVFLLDPVLPATTTRRSPFAPLSSTSVSLDSRALDSIVGMSATRRLAALITSAAVLALPLAAKSVTSADAATRDKNCTALNKKYHHGVADKKLDRDKDGIACRKH